MAQLNVLLGAGFSRLAGLPLVKDFNPYFNRDVTDKILAISSGEWFWRDGADHVAVHNGTLSTDHFIFGFVLQEVLIKYGEITNYEEFYDFLVKNDNTFYKICFDLGRQKLKHHYNLEEDNSILTSTDWNQYHKIVGLFNSLIIGLLELPEINEELLTKYDRFFEWIKNYDQVRIFSLNHDLLLEELLQHRGIRYSDGFTEANSVLFGANEVPQKMFLDDFNENIRIYKLHGSAGTYGYKVGHEQGSIINPTGEIIYFKPDSHDTKHFAIRKDPTSGEILQTLNIDISPKFITGKNKNEFVTKDKMYSKLFEHFREEHLTATELLIIGYSYGDDHVNDIIKRGNLPKITNVNPGPCYPYSNAGEIINHKYISDL